MQIAIKLFWSRVLLKMNSIAKQSSKIKLLKLLAVNSITAMHNRSMPAFFLVKK